MEISDYAHYAVFLHWLHSLRCFTLLLLKWNMWLRSLRCFSSLTAIATLFYFITIKWKSLSSLRCFTFTSIKMKYLTTLTTLFYFTTTDPRDRTTPSTLLLALIHEIVFPQEFQCFHKICMWHSKFHCQEVQWSLNALLPPLFAFLLCYQK